MRLLLRPGPGNGPPVLVRQSFPLYSKDTALYRTDVATWTTASGTKTATITTVPGDLLVALVANTGSTAVPVLSDNQGGVWEQVLFKLFDNNNSGIGVWVRTKPVAVGASTIVTMTPGATTGGGLDVIAISGVLRAGMAAIRSLGFSTAISGTPAPVLSKTPLIENMIIGVVSNGTNPATIAPRAGFTERQNLGYQTPASGLETMTRNSGETTATQTWGGPANSPFGAVVVEIDVSPPDAFYYPNPARPGLAPRHAGPPILGRQFFDVVPAGGSQAFAQTFTDPESLNDALALLVVYVRAQTDAEGLTDPLVRVLVAVRSQTDLVGALDSATRLLTALRAQTDAEGIVDSLTRAIAYLRSVTDPEGLSDSALRAAGYVRSQTDTEGITDAMTFLKVIAKLQTDAEGITDAASRLVAYLRTSTDAEGLLDAITRLGAYARSRTDLQGITDAVTVLKSVEKSFTDSELLSDLATRVAANMRSRLDPQGITDTVSYVFTGSARSLVVTAGRIGSKWKSGDLETKWGADRGRTKWGAEELEGKWDTGPLDIAWDD